MIIAIMNRIRGREPLHWERLSVMNTFITEWFIIANAMNNFGWVNLNIG